MLNYLNHSPNIFPNYSVSFCLGHILLTKAPSWITPMVQCCHFCFTLSREKNDRTRQTGSAWLWFPISTELSIPPYHSTQKGPPLPFSWIAIAHLNLPLQTPTPTLSLRKWLCLSLTEKTEAVSQLLSQHPLLSFTLLFYRAKIPFLSGSQPLGWTPGIPAAWYSYSCLVSSHIGPGFISVNNWIGQKWW